MYFDNYDVRASFLDELFGGKDGWTEKVETLTANWKHEERKIELAKDLETYYTTDNILIKTAIGKKWAEVFDYDYDACKNVCRMYKHNFFRNENVLIESSFNYEHVLWVNGVYYRGDTMNSWLTTVNEFFRIFGGDYLYGVTWEHEKFILDEDHRVAGWVELMCDPANYTDTELPEYIVKFLNVVYTPGNFIPVPVFPNFNTKRYMLCSDYWDLTLLAIYKYYMGMLSDHSIAWNKLLNKMGIKQWLKSFGTRENGWYNFVTFNFLQDFVENRPKGTFGPPKELWVGHFVNFRCKPQTEAEFKEFFTNAYNWINTRSRRMENYLDISIVNYIIEGKNMKASKLDGPRDEV